MTKRKLVWITVALLIVVSSFGLVVGINSVQDITLTEQDVQSRINDKLPLEKNGMVLRDMQVNFENNLLNVTASFEGKKWGQEFSATMNMDGTPYYSNLDGTFHFRPNKITVREIKVKGEAVSTKVEKFIDKYVDSPKINQNASEIATKIEEWVNGSIENTTTYALQRIPIYTLPDTLKGNTVRMLLESVEIGNDNLTLHLSFWQFTKMALMYIIIFLVALVMAVALLMNPEWGMVFLFVSSIGDIGS